MTTMPGPWPDSEMAAGQSLADAVETHFQEAEEGPPTPEDLENAGRVIEAQATHEASLMALPNVIGVASSIKVSNGQPTGEMSVSALVEKKRAKSGLRKAELVPDVLDGVPTDVVEVGMIRALAFTARVRPALPGFSLGHHDITAGTFGCLVRDIRRCCHAGDDCDCHDHQHGHHRHDDEDFLILSNNHVMAATNAAQIGDSILQPGPFDGGLFPSDEVAKLERFERIVFGMTGYNLVDAAVARPTASRNVTSAIIGVLTPRGIAEANVGDQVIKAGRTTEVTVGRVLAVNATIAVNYGAPGVATFRHQIVTTGMSAGGDSGSLLMNSDFEAVGLLYAGSAVVTIHNHIADVETALGVRPVTTDRA